MIGLVLCHCMIGLSFACFALNRSVLNAFGAWNHHFTILCMCAKQIKVEKMLLRRLLRRWTALCVTTKLQSSFFWWKHHSNTHALAKDHIADPNAIFTTSHGPPLRKRRRIEVRTGVAHPLIAPAHPLIAAATQSAASDDGACTCARV